MIKIIVGSDPQTRSYLIFAFIEKITALLMYK